MTYRVLVSSISYKESYLESNMTLLPLRVIFVTY